MSDAPKFTREELEYLLSAEGHKGLSALVTPTFLSVVRSHLTLLDEKEQAERERDEAEEIVRFVSYTDGYDGYRDANDANRGRLGRTIRDGTWQEYPNKMQAVAHRALERKGEYGSYETNAERMICPDCELAALREVVKVADVALTTPHICVVHNEDKVCKGCVAKARYRVTRAKVTLP